MAKRKDIMLDENQDLLIRNGDFVISESDEQHIHTIMHANKGDFKQHPAIGVAITSLLNSTFKARDIKRAIKVELERDGYSDVDIDLNMNLKTLNINVSN